MTTSRGQQQPDWSAVHQAWMAMERHQGRVIVRGLGPKDATFVLDDDPPHGRWRWRLDPDGTVVRDMAQRQPFGAEFKRRALTQYRRAAHYVLPGDSVGPPPSTPWRPTPALTRAAPQGEPDAER